LRALAAPALSAEQLLDALRASRLFPAYQFEAILAARPHGSAGAWAMTLVERGLLTAFQAEELLAGRGDLLVIGPYRILDPIGAGGMGRVYKAEHPLMKRVVAIKVLADHLVHDAEALRQFHREVEVAARLAHPNIVTAYDAAEWNDLHYFVMEYVDGNDLGRRVEQEGPLPVPLACEYIRQAALGLQHAHECGLVHSDIKPANLLVRQRPAGGSPSASGFEPPLLKILDFGLAGIPQPGMSTGGTPDFMAPERARAGRAVDIRSDLYGLGCTFYYLLTGRVPYPSDSWAEKLLHHQFDQAEAVRALRLDIPEAVAAIIEKLMAKEPAERFPTPAALAECLGAWLATQGDSLAPATPAPPACLVRTPLATDGITWHDAAVIDREPVATEGTVAPASDTPEVRASAASPRPLLRRPFAVLAAMATGLLLALLVRPLARTSPEVGVLPASIVPTLTDYVALARDPGRPFTSLQDALAAAREGDTLIIHGQGPFRWGPAVLGDKALTIQAAPNCRPHIELTLAVGQPRWQPLLSASRSLRLHGLVLTQQVPATPVSPDTSHLVYTSGPEVRLVDCELLAPGARALVVCRNAGAVELRGCRLLGEALAVCVEAGTGSATEVDLVGNTVTVTGSHAAALALWEAAGRNAGPVRVRMERNTVRAGRIVALAQPVRGLEILGRANAFLFRDTLLDGAGAAGLALHSLETASRGLLP
jgi:serine/threonine protein kinase